jgi:cysteine desulfurase
LATDTVRAETALIALDLAGLAVSSGSACSSGRVQSSHVLAAMGVPAALVAGAIRVSLGPENDVRDVERFVDVYARLYQVRYRHRHAARERVA